jgi:hypothetical protein
VLYGKAYHIDDSGSRLERYHTEPFDAERLGDICSFRVCKLSLLREKRQACVLYTMWQTYLLLATLPVLFLWKCRRILAVPNYVKKRACHSKFFLSLPLRSLGFVRFIKTQDGSADVA